MGGDLNCRFGDMNTLFNVDHLVYEPNVDGTSNKHGSIYGKDICSASGIFPLNHLMHKGKPFEGDFTYHKGGKKSQIDFVFTDKEGLQLIKNF